MNDCDLDTPVPDWVIEHPATLAVFQEFGIDYSCGGKSLAYTCRQQGIDEQFVLKKLFGCLHVKHEGAAAPGEEKRHRRPPQASADNNELGSWGRK